MKGAAADTVCNMGAEASVDSIIKKFTSIYGIVKAFDLLMGGVYREDQEDEESVPSFARHRRIIVQGKFSQTENLSWGAEISQGQALAW